MSPLAFSEQGRILQNTFLRQFLVQVGLHYLFNAVNVIAAIIARPLRSWNNAARCRIERTITHSLPPKGQAVTRVLPTQRPLWSWVCGIVWIFKITTHISIVRPRVSIKKIWTYALPRINLFNRFTFYYYLTRTS